MKKTEKNLTDYQKESLWQDRFIIDLNLKDARQEEGRLVWDAVINHQGRYDLQILRTRAHKSDRAPEYKWETRRKVIIGFADQEQEAILNPDPDYHIDDKPVPLVISHVTLRKMIEAPGCYRVSMETSGPVSGIWKLRLVPLHNYSFSANDDYRGQFEKMAAADTKQDALKNFNESKYGMFIHWGLYSMPGGECKGLRMEDMAGPPVAEWIMRNAPIDRNEYRQLAQDFNPSRDAAGNWVKLAKAAGMKYIFLTAKHHDDFALWDSEASDYNIA